MSKKTDDLKQRSITAFILLIPGVFITYTSFFNGVIFTLFILVLELAVAFEIHQMLEKRSYNSHLWLTSFFASLSLLNHFLNGAGILNNEVFRIVFDILIGLFVLALLLQESVSDESTNFDKALENIGIPLFSYIILGLFFPIVVLIKLKDPSGWLLTILLSLAWMTDVGGLIFGNLFGKHPLKFLSSPRKTIAGYTGGFFTSLLTGTVLYFIQQKFPVGTSFSLLQLLFLASVISICSMIGDLGESTFKRWAHSKDSGNLLPGHGGIFDRTDSVLFSAPIFWFLIRIMG